MQNRYPKVKYADIGELSIAYQVWGDAEKVLVYVPGIVSHLEVGPHVFHLLQFIQDFRSDSFFF